MNSMAGTPAIALLLPPYEREAIAEELRQGGFDPIIIHGPEELEGILASRHDLTMAVLDIVGDLDDGIMCWALLHERDRNIPSLLVVDNGTLDRLDFDAPGHENDEYITRPYGAESIRWRVEAMCIRSVAVDDGSGPVLQSAI